MTKVQAEIDWIIANPIVYVFVANGNFGVFPDRDIPIARMLRAAADHPDSQLESVNVQYLKNNTETALIVERTLNGLGKGITLSRQSNDGMVLEAIKRKNLSTEKFANLIELSNYYNVPNYTEFILPLPLETLDTFKQGICSTLSEGQHNSIDVWPASVLPKAEMGSPEYIEKYGLVTVPVSNYSQYSGQSDNHDHIDYTDGDTTEITDVVIETNTMSRSEVLEAWSFIWVVSRFHFCGYSQILSRYLHGCHDISYYDFYTKIFKRFQTDAWMSEVYQQISYIIEHQLIHGSFPDPDTLTVKGLVPEVISYHFVNQLARGFVYDNRDRISQLAIEVAQEFCDIPLDIINLQDNFIYDPENTYPQTHQADFDIFTNTLKPTTYLIHDKADYTKRLAERAPDKDLGVFTQRRQGYRCYLTTPERNALIDNMQETADQKVSDILDRIERGEKITRTVIASS